MYASTGYLDAGSKFAIPGSRNLGIRSMHGSIDRRRSDATVLMATAMFRARSTFLSMLLILLLLDNVECAAAGMLDLPARKMWGWSPPGGHAPASASGYCGSMSLQTAAIYYGSWLSHLTRSVAHPGGTTVSA